MANIDISNISDLDVNGNSLFDDSESFLNNLDDLEINNTKGGITPTPWIITTITIKTIEVIE